MHNKKPSGSAADITRVKTEVWHLIREASEDAGTALRALEKAAQWDRSLSTNKVFMKAHRSLDKALKDVETLAEKGAEARTFKIGHGTYEVI